MSYRSSLVHDIVERRTNVIFTVVVVILISQISSSSFVIVYGQAPSDTDALIKMVNIERIRTQLWLSEQRLVEGNSEMAFAHAFIPHTTTFPAIKDQLMETSGQQSTSQLESLLTDLPLKIRTGDYSREEAIESIRQINILLDEISQQSIGPQYLSDKGMVSQVIVFLLRDAMQSYSTVSNASSGSGSQNLPQDVNYENAAGLVHMAHQRYQDTLS